VEPKDSQKIILFIIKKVTHIYSYLLRVRL